MTRKAKIITGVVVGLVIATGIGFAIYYSMISKNEDGGGGDTIDDAPKIDYSKLKHSKDVVTKPGQSKAGEGKG